MKIRHGNEETLKVMKNCVIPLQHCTHTIAHTPLHHNTPTTAPQHTHHCTTTHPPLHHNTPTTAPHCTHHCSTTHPPLQSLCGIIKIIYSLYLLLHSFIELSIHYCYSPLVHRIINYKLLFSIVLSNYQFLTPITPLHVVCTVHDIKCTTKKSLKMQTQTK